MIKSSKTAVESEELNSDSNLEATALGMKSNTDIWVRENKLLDSRIGLADSQRRKIVASVNLLMLSGNLSIHSLLNKIKKSSNRTKNKKTIKGSYV
jgi:outer membrane protein TolC